MFLRCSSTTYNILTSTNSLFWTFTCYSKTPKILLIKYIPHSIFCYMLAIRLRVNLVAGFCCFPFLLYVVLQRVIYRLQVVTRDIIPAYYQLLILLLHGGVSHCSYQKCTTSSKLMGMPRYSPIANFHLVYYMR